MIFSLFAFAIVGASLALPQGELALDGGNTATVSFAASALANPRFAIYGQGTYMNAIQICSAAGMRLVVIDDQNKSDEVTYFVDKESAINGPFYTSASRLVDDETWAFHDGRPVKYFNWDDGEPNNLGGNEKCVEIYKNGRWNDIDCSRQRFVLCERVAH